MTVHNWIDFFMGCEECRTHFLAMSQRLPSAVTTRQDAMLWLWQAHNRVNLRLRQEQQQVSSLHMYSSGCLSHRP